MSTNSQLTLFWPTHRQPSLRSVARPADGAPPHPLVPLSRELGCAVGGGFAAGVGLNAYRDRTAVIS
jgi:hypothetical protein